MLITAKIGLPSAYSAGVWLCYLLIEDMQYPTDGRRLDPVSGWISVHLDKLSQFVRVTSRDPNSKVGGSRAVVKNGQVYGASHCVYVRSEVSGFC